MPVPTSTMSWPAATSAALTCSLRWKPAWSDPMAMHVRHVTHAALGPRRPQARCSAGGLERRGDRRGTRPAHDLPAAVGLVAAQVDHGRRRAGQLAAVEHEVGRRARIARGPPSSAPRVRPAGGLALDCRTGQRTARSAASAAGSAGTRSPSVVRVRRRRPAGSGARGLGSSSVTAPGQQRARAPARVRGPSSRQRGQRERRARRTSPPRACPAGGP